MSSGCLQICVPKYCPDQFTALSTSTVPLLHFHIISLKETRLGKLINDVRRKTKNEDLAKRAKRLLRNWQKLIEPGLDESLLTKNHSNTSWSSSSGLSYPHSSSPSAIAPLSGKTVPELKNRNDFNNFNPEVKEKPSRKRKSDHNEDIPAKLSNTKHNLKLTTSNNCINGLKIPVNAVKPSGLEYNRPLSTSLLLKASVFQQQATSRGQSRPKSPCSSSHSPPNQETVKKTRQQTQNPQTLRHESVDNSVSCRIVLEDAGSRGEKQKDTCHFEKEKLGESVKPVKLKDRRLTFDPITCQIKRSCSKEAEQETELKPDNQRFELQTNQQVASGSSFQHTDWKELSRSEIIQSYLSQQSSVLSSSGLPSARLFTSEVLKKDNGKDEKKTHMLLKETQSSELPGVNREIKSADVDRLHTQRWSGVNGCFDTKGKWFNWTECISLDLHEDGSRLNILPYVCLD